MKDAEMLAGKLPANSNSYFLGEIMTIVSKGTDNPDQTGIDGCELCRRPRRSAAVASVDPPLEDDPSSEL